MICPMMTIGTADATDCERNCEKDNCAWWNGNTGECIIKSLENIRHALCVWESTIKP